MQSWSGKILSEDPLLHSCVKHINIKYHFLCEHIQSNELQLSYVNTMIIVGFSPGPLWHQPGYPVGQIQSLLRLQILHMTSNSNPIACDLPLYLPTQCLPKQEMPCMSQNDNNGSMKFCNIVSHYGSSTFT